MVSMPSGPARRPPHELYGQAVETLGAQGEDAVRAEYHRLMVEHGHLVPRPACTCGAEPHAEGCPRFRDNDRRLACGWLPGERATTVPQVALSVWQPWAYLLVTGLKDTENRRWRTKYRGRLWIHASQRLDENAYFALSSSGVSLPEHLPRGALVGAVELVGCVRDSSSRWAEPGCWHWQVGRAWALPEPIPMRGRQGLFRVELPGRAA
jgi:hypothetical protein